MENQQQNLNILFVKTGESVYNAVLKNKLYTIITLVSIDLI